MTELKKLREEFPVTNRLMFLDHAAVSPLPARTVDAMSWFLRDICDNSVLHKQEWNRKVNEARALAAKMLNCTPQEIAFVRNTTEGILFVANGIRWREGDNVVITNVEYPANVYPWMNLSRLGVETRFVRERNGRIAVRELIEAADSRTRCISISFVEFCSGFRNDLRQIGDFCRKRGVIFCVDAIQGLGALQLDVRECCIDFLSCGGHKWLLAPQGTGIFFCDRQALDKIALTSIGADSVVNAEDYLDYDMTPLPDARRFEYGSLNKLGIIGLGASLSLLLEVGIGTIEERVIDLTDHLCNALARKGYTIFSPREPGEKSGIVSFFHPRMDTEELFSRIREAGIVISRRGNYIRVSPHFYNTEGEIDELVGVLP